MIQAYDGVIGSPCYICGERIGSGFELAEVREDQWEVICEACWLVAEIGEGK